MTEAVSPVAATTEDRGAPAPLAESEVAALLAPVERAQAVAVAVSGGADSLALLAAAAAWSRLPYRPDVVVLTVDHGLSPGSDAVAKRVLEAARRHGLAARPLRWDGPRPATGIEAAARLARYRLLKAAAIDAGASHLLTAHSLEDQAETFLMRIERGSGVFGLAGMRREIGLDGLVLFRPFLGVPRARLAATAAAAGLRAHDDPMNADARFLRVRMRALLPVLAKTGIAPEALASTAARLADASDAIDAWVDRIVAADVTVDAAAMATIAAAAFASLPETVRYRLLVRLLQAIGGDDYPPRAAQVEGLVAGLSAPAATPKRTLAGVVVERRAAHLRLYREAGRQGLPELPAVPGSTVVWDHRFRLAVAATARPGLAIAALALRRPEALVRPSDLPYAAMAAVPAIFDGERLLSVPAFGWVARGQPDPGVTAAETVSGRLRRPPRFPTLAD